MNLDKPVQTCRAACNLAKLLEFGVVFGPPRNEWFVKLSTSRTGLEYNAFSDLEVARHACVPLLVTGATQTRNVHRKAPRLIGSRTLAGALFPTLRARRAHRHNRIAGASRGLSRHATSRIEPLANGGIADLDLLNIS